MQNDPQSLAASSNSVEVSQSQGLPVADNNGGSGSAPMQVSAVVAPSSPTSHGLSANATLGRIIQSGPAVPMLPFLPGGAIPTLDHAIHDYLVKRGLTMLAHQFLQHISLVPTAPAPNSMLGSVWKFWQNHATFAAAGGGANPLSLIIPDKDSMGKRSASMAFDPTLSPNSKKLKLNKQETGDMVRVKCTVPGCDKSFTKVTNLRRHERLHSGYKPFTCGVPSAAGKKPCGKKFARRADLRAHERTHTGEKPYNCSVCQRKFARNSDWRSHERTHQGVKPYNCEDPACSKTFARKSDAKKHIRIHSDGMDSKDGDDDHDHEHHHHHAHHHGVDGSGMAVPFTVSGAAPSLAFVTGSVVVNPSDGNGQSQVDDGAAQPPPPSDGSLVADHGLDLQGGQGKKRPARVNRGKNKSQRMDNDQDMMQMAPESIIIPVATITNPNQQ